MSEPADSAESKLLTPPADEIAEVVVRSSPEPAMQDVAIADTTHVQVNFDGDVCGYQPLAKKGAFTLGGSGCADIFNREASAGISLTYAPERGIAGPVRSATLHADASYELGGDKSKIITASVEVATPIKGLHLDIGAKTHGHGVSAYVGVMKPL